MTGAAKPTVRLSSAMAVVFRSTSRNVSPTNRSLKLSNQIHWLPKMPLVGLKRSKAMARPNMGA